MAVERSKCEGTFPSRREAAAFAQAFTAAAFDRLKIKILKVIYEPVGAPSADEWRLAFDSDTEIIAPTLYLFEKGYDAACDFRRIV